MEGTGRLRPRRSRNVGFRQKGCTSAASPRRPGSFVYLFFLFCFVFGGFSTPSPWADSLGFVGGAAKPLQRHLPPPTPARLPSPAAPQVVRRRMLGINCAICWPRAMGASQLLCFIRDTVTDKYKSSEDQNTRENNSHP